jgi:hypothetical protein
MAMVILIHISRHTPMYNEYSLHNVVLECNFNCFVLAGVGTFNFLLGDMWFTSHLHAILVISMNEE